MHVSIIYEQESVAFIKQFKKYTQDYIQKFKATYNLLHCTDQDKGIHFTFFFITKAMCARSTNSVHIYQKRVILDNSNQAKVLTAIKGSRFIHLLWLLYNCISSYHYIINDERCYNGKD